MAHTPQASLPNMPTENNQKPDLQSAYLRLEEIARKIEDPETTIDESMPLFKEGMELAKFLEGRLKEVENEITEIKKQVLDES